MTAYTLVAPDRNPILAWVPTPYKPMPGAPCPTCGDLDAVIYSLTHQYAACLGCGWQRRLTTRPQRLALALAASGYGAWAPVLWALADAPPDALPPVAALLWHPVAPDVWAGPSRSVPDTQYTVEIVRSRLICSCQGRRHAACWHRDLVRALAGVPVPEAALWDPAA